MELAILAGLTSIGYYLNKDGRPEKKNINAGLVSNIEKPSADNIYQSRFMEKAWNDEFQRSSANYRASLNPDKTGVVNGKTYKDYQNNKYEKRLYSKSNRVVQQEKDLQRAEPDTTTKMPSSTLNVFDTSFSLIDPKKVEDIQTKTFNSRRNNMPNPEFEAYPTGDKQGIYRTVFSNEKQDGKSVRMYDKGHNNMEPFFGSSIKQNTRADANRTLLEHHTGANPIFKHKKEVKRMFPVVKNPYAVGGMPVANNREVDRYIPSIKKTNILPFEQKRVAPGLNKAMTEDSSTIGFHDTYRPLGQGSYQDVDKLRVNPKSQYKSRIAGEKFFITKGQKAKPVVSRQPVDLSFTTFAPGKEGFNNSGNYKYRENVTTGSQVKKAQPLSKDTILLKNTDRQDYAAKIGNLKGHARDQNQRGQTYSFDDARTTIKQQTEKHIHSHINDISSVKRNQVNPYDDAKGTIKQQTEKHMHSHINRGDGDRKGQTYHFDDANETIRQQTQDHKHSHINRGDGDRRGQTYWFDGAKETIKQQTQNHKHSHINAGSTSDGRKVVHRGNYENAEINALKEHSLHRRKPVSQGAKAIGGKNLYNIDVRKTQFDTYDKTRRMNPSAVPTYSKQQIGLVTQQKPNYADKDLLQSRINPLFTEQFKKNPYTQSLSSYQVPYNPAYPKK